MDNDIESYMRERIDLLQLDDFTNEDDLSLDFLREFADRINWKAIFDTKYLYYQYDIAISNDGLASELRVEPVPFEDWMKENYKQFYHEYFEKWT